MPTPINISARDFARDQSTIVDGIIATGRPIIITYRSVPRVAVVDLKVFESVKKASQPNTSKALLDLAEEGKKLAKKYKDKYPTDLSKNLDKYAWG